MGSWGPGNSMMPFLHLYQYEWENDFTVVNWDQRNVGKTYFANDPAAVLQTMSAERVLQDVHEVTAYLKQQFNKEKIILIGHSWGTVLGTMAVQTYPEDYSAYIGIAQTVNMVDNERVGYEKTLEMVKAAGKQKISRRWKLLHHIRQQNMVQAIWRSYDSKNIPKQVWAFYKYGFGQYNQYTGNPVLFIERVKNTTIVNPNAIDNQGDVLRFLVEEADIRNYGVDYQVPVYYIMGENDYNSPYLPAKKFLMK